MSHSEPITDVFLHPSVKILKIKKNVPTVVEIDGQRYVMDHSDHRRGKGVK